MLDADIVEVARSVDDGLKIRLGHQGQVARTALPPDVARQNAAGAFRMHVARAQDAEPGGFHPFEMLAAAGPAQPILPIAQECEVTIAHPGKQRLGFTDVARIETRIQRMQVVGGPAGRGLHLLPVGTGNPHIGHAAFYLALQRAQDLRIDDAVHFDVLK
jgi:hypothetical protein